MIHIGTDAHGLWAWMRVSGDGKLVASGEGYATEQEAIAACAAADAPRWCDQCERKVRSSAAEGCGSRWCGIRQGVHIGARVG